MDEPKIVTVSEVELQTSSKEPVRTATWANHFGLMYRFGGPGPVWFDRANATLLRDALTAALGEG